jgi:hypothetical protein
VRKGKIRTRKEEKEKSSKIENFESTIFKRGKTRSEKALHTLQPLLK